MRKKFIYFASILLLVLVNACTNKTVNVERLNATNTPSMEINTKIRLIKDPEFPNSYKNSNATEFLIMNQSKDSILFPPGFGMKVDQKTDQGWRPVENRAEYPERNLLLRPSSVDPAGYPIIFLPHIPDLKVPTTLRVEVVGYVENKPEEQVSAYIDFIIDP